MSVDVTAFAVVASGAFGAAAGTLAGFLGIGGGAILPPLLVFVLGIEQHVAQGISLAALVPPVGLPAVLAYRRAGVRVDVRRVAFLVLGFVFGGVLGAWLSHRVSSGALRLAFAGFLAVSAYRALAKREGDVDIHADCTRSAPWIGVLIGLSAGVLSGLLGVGGGLVALPLLRHVAKLGRLEAQATTLAMMLLPIGLPAVFVYARTAGDFPWTLLVAVGVGFAGGAGLGGRLAGRVAARHASFVYASLLGVLAILLIARP